MGLPISHPVMHQAFPATSAAAATGAAHMHQPGLVRSPSAGMMSSKGAEVDGDDTSSSTSSVSTATSHGGKASAPDADAEETRELRGEQGSRHQTSSELSERSADTDPIPTANPPQASAKPVEKLPQSVPEAVPPAKSSTTDLPHHEPSQHTDVHEQLFRKDMKNLCLEGAWHKVLTFLLRDDLMQFTFTTMDSPLHLALLATRSDPLIWCHVEAIVNARPDLAHVYNHDEATCLRIASAEYQIQPPKREDQLALFLAVSPSLNRATLSSEQIVVRSRAINAIMAANQAALAMTDAEARSPFHLSLFTPGFLFGVAQHLFAAFPGAACSPDYLGHYPLHTLCKSNEPIPAMLLSVLIDAYPGATSVRVTEDGSDDKCHTPGTFLVQNEVNKGCLQVLMDKINMYVASPAFTDVMVASQRKSESARLIWQASTQQASSPDEVSQRPPTDEIEDEVEGEAIPSPDVAEDFEAREREKELNEDAETWTARALEKKVAEKELKKKKELARQFDLEQERLRRQKHEMRKKQRAEKQLRKKQRAEKQLRKKREDMERHYAGLKAKATAQLNALRDIGIPIEKAVRYAEMDPSSAEWKAAKKENADIVKQGQIAMRENIRLKGLLLAKQAKNKKRLEKIKLQEEEVVMAKRSECATQLRERRDKCIEELCFLYEEAEKKASDIRKQALRDAVLEAEGLEKEKASFLEAETKEHESKEKLAKMRSERDNRLRAVQEEHEAIMARDRKACLKKMNELLSQIEIKRREVIDRQEERSSKYEDPSCQGSHWVSNDDSIIEPPIEGQVGENETDDEAVKVMFALREDITHCEGVIDHLLSRKRKRDIVTPHSEDDYVDVVGLDDDDAVNANELFGITERGP